MFDLPHGHKNYVPVEIHLAIDLTRFLKTYKILQNSGKILLKTYKIFQDCCQSLTLQARSKFLERSFKILYLRFL